MPGKTKQAPMRLTGPGTFPLDIVGESNYQQNLEGICGKRSKEGEDRTIAALLVLEERNKFDPYAVRVDIQGKTVGYLAKEKAPEFRNQMAQLGLQGPAVSCRALIRGGWDRGSRKGIGTMKGDRGHYGVQLDVSPTSTLIEDAGQTAIEPGAKRRRWPIIVGGLVAVCVCAVIAIAVLSPPAPGATQTPEGVAQVVTDMPVSTQGPTEAPTPALSPVELLCRGISRDLGSSNREMLRMSGCTLDNGELSMRWSINDNLSEDLIRRGAQMDVEKLVRFTHDLGFEYDTIHVQGTFAMVDVYGNTAEDVVVDLIYQKTTVDEVQWASFLTDNIYVIADEVVLLHPQFQP